MDWPWAGEFDALGASIFAANAAWYQVLFGGLAALATVLAVRAAFTIQKRQFTRETRERERSARETQIRALNASRLVLWTTLRHLRALRHMMTKRPFDPVELSKRLFFLASTRATLSYYLQQDYSGPETRVILSMTDLLSSKTIGLYQAVLSGTVVKSKSKSKSVSFEQIRHEYTFQLELIRSIRQRVRAQEILQSELGQAAVLVAQLLDLDAKVAIDGKAIYVDALGEDWARTQAPRVKSRVKRLAID